MRFPFSMSDKSLMHSSSAAGREIFVSHNSGRVTAHTEVIQNGCNVRLGDHTPRTPKIGRFAAGNVHWPVLVSGFRPRPMPKCWLNQDSS
jgi:hypothetical protein